MGGTPTVLLVRLGPDALLFQHLLDFREELGFLVVMVAFHESEPCKAVAHEVGLVGFLDVRRLQVDSVEAAENGIVEEGHVRGAFGPDILLLGRILRSLDQWAGAISPRLSGGDGARNGRHAGR